MTNPEINNEQESLAVGHQKPSRATRILLRLKRIGGNDFVNRPPIIKFSIAVAALITLFDIIRAIYINGAFYINDRVILNFVLNALFQWLIFYFVITNDTVKSFLRGILRKNIEISEFANIGPAISKLSDADKLAHYNRLAILVDLRNRIKMLRGRSTVILITIGAALISAALIVIFAGQLTSLDAKAVGSTDRLRSEINAIDSQIATLSEARSILKRATLPKDGKESGNNRDIDDAWNRFTRGNVLNYIPPKDLEALEDAYKSALTNKSHLDDLMQKAWAKEINSERGYSDVKYLIATAITRIGVVVIIVFLVQILLDLYRYNTRLLSYYNSYADVVTLWDGSDQKLELMIKSFPPPKVDFGKEPKHPLQDIIRAVESHMKSSGAQNASGAKSHEKSS